MNLESFRQVPVDIEVEQAVLGSVLVDNRRLESLSTILKEEEFYDPLHRRTYATMLKVWEQGRAITPLTLKALMRDDPGLVEIGSDYFVNLADAAPAAANMRELARIVHEAAVRRELFRIGEDLVNNAIEVNVDQPPRAIIEDAEKALYRVAENSKYGEGPIDFAESLRRAVENAERAQARGGRISGVASGFTELDSLLGGLQPSDLIIVAGRPGMGKSSLATNMAFHAARAYVQDMEAGAEVARGAPVLLFSLEMAAQQLAARILSEQTEIEMWKIRNGRFAESEWEKFVLTMQELSTLPLFIDDSGGISIAQIAARARRLKREKQIGVIIIDYLQLIEPSRRAENRVQEITEVTKGLKALAKELNVPVIALSQLSRGVDSRDDKRPVLSDLRESGSIEQDADVVMFVYREEYYLKSREPDPSSAEHAKWLEKCERVHRRAEILVEKHRHGATNKIDLFFDDRFTRFSNLAAEGS
ncbi:MAG: replicative DNA helicase [Alphaproteobacteria bacterium]|nr:replicative DNA helicase [Alphaproteobacteria bacterium]MBV9694156.1 replicative DNA helicase [Alphaproteobacteria bacterium]